VGGVLLKQSGTGFDNARSARIILALAGLALPIYLALALSGDLRGHFELYLLGHGLLAASMLVAWRIARRDHRTLSLVLGAAVLFRLVAALGAPSLSDDVYRYVWDGRVQLHGVHPYEHAPSDPELGELRDENWELINHPELITIYPPLAEGFFLLLAAAGAGPVGFKLALGLLDFGVVLALGLLLRRMSLPPDRVVLYAWNPVAVLETAGSGHVEPLGVLLVVLAVIWIEDRRPRLSMLALAAAVHVKLLPALLLPTWLRRAWGVPVLVLALGLVIPALPYALTGPAVGAGLFAYAERWEHNAFFYAGLETLLPGPQARETARLIMGFLVVAWAVFLAWGRRLAPARETLWVFGAVLLLSPTVHPWYVLWVLPFAAACLSPGWLLFGLLVPLAYVEVGGELPWAVKCVEYLPPLALMVWGAIRAIRSDGGHAR